MLIRLLKARNQGMRSSSLPLFTVFIAILAVTGCSAARPLHRTHASIRASLLKRTPPGTPRPDVVKYITRSRWSMETNQVTYFLGYSARQGGGPPPPDSVRSVIMAEFGHYPIFIGNRYIYGLWAFDESDHLVDIWIYKERDSL